MSCPATYFWLSGCKPASERCPSVLIQSLRNTTYELTERRFADALREAQLAQLGNRDTTFMEHGHPVTMKTGPYIEPSDAEKAHQRRAIRAPVQDGDSTEPPPEPPPRPSEVQWYNEHCYQGKPR